MAYLGVDFVDGFAWQSYLKAEEGLIYASKYGYDYWYIDGSIHSDFAENWNKKRIDNISTKCTEYNIKPIYHGNFKVPLSSDVHPLRLCAIEYIKSEIDICSKLNCPLIIHGSAIIEPRKILLIKKMAINNLIDSLIILKNYTDNQGVKIWLENLSNYTNYKPFYYVGTTIEEFSFILSQIEIPIFLDLGHANINAKCSVGEFFKAFHSSIIGISMSNNDGKLDQHLGLESGSINYHDILCEIINSGWHGIIGFETRNSGPQESIQSLYSLVNTINFLNPPKLRE